MFKFLFNINEKSIRNIIKEIIKYKPKSKVNFNNARRKVCSKLKIPQPANRQLLQAYQEMIKKKRGKIDKKMEILMRKADIRTLSGITVITSLTKAYNCPGQCVYCPLEEKMPKSYLPSEPAAARALALKFNPYTQMQQRIEMLKKNGHPTEKIEYIIKGGTWNAYPDKYKYWFILESFRASNNSKSKKDEHKSLTYLQTELKKEQTKNEKSKHKIIGLTLETRPDFITPKNIYNMRQQGCTRIELGLQAPDDKILKLIRRGHTVQQFRDAMFLLRQAGFKVDLHFMPDLPGTTPKHDVEMYKSLFTDPGLRPDMLKIYPCAVIKSAKLYDWYKEKKYQSYGKDKLFKALLQMKLATPRYCRISRLIRDIPDNEIQSGNKITNLREQLQQELKKQKLKCNCLRCREIGHQKENQHLKPKLFIDKYETIGGTEYFISFEDKQRQVVFAFLRLRIPLTSSVLPLKNKQDELFLFLPEIKDSAFIRELHTYGQLIEVGEKDKKATQHHGWGKKLVKEAEKIAKKNKFKKIAVISGVGVRDYYRHLGYRQKETYMIKNNLYKH